MKNPDELKKYYDEQLLPELSVLEGERKKTLVKMLLLSGGLFFLFIVISIVALLLDNSGSLCGVVLCCPLPIFLMVWTFGCNFIKKGYVKSFKGNIIAKIVKFIDPALEYAHDKGISREMFSRSRIFLQTVDLFSSEDYVSGTIDKTKIEFSEVHAQDRQETHDSDGHHQTRYVTIFRGVFFAADFNKRFSGRTLVLPDTAQKLFGNLIGSALQSKNFMRPPLVKLEDPEFEKLFVVYGDDQVEARYILSTSLMSRITEFKKKSGRDIFLSFVDDKVIVALPYKKDLFEPHLFRSIMDYPAVEEYFRDLQFVLSLVGDLNLNTRIWSKE
jgi:hypothetical protein